METTTIQKSQSAITKASYKTTINSVVMLFVFIGFTGFSQTITTIKAGGQSPIGPLNTVGAGPDVNLYAGGTSRFQAQPGAISYLWRPSTGLSDSTISNPFVTVNTTTTYTVRIKTSSSTNDYTVSAVVLTSSSMFTASCSNWVPNGDFEEHYGCVDDWSELSFQTNWYNAGGSCDFYTACNYLNVQTNFFFMTFSFDWVTYPTNSQGTQTSAGYGNSYAGIINSSYSEQWPYFEYMGASLACPLITGQQYKLQFDASWANQSNYDCGNIGMYLSTNQILASPYGSQIVVTPQVDGACGATTSWLTFTNTYVGAGEKYVTIGNFDANAASLGGCNRVANNSIPEPPGYTGDAKADYTYNYVDNIIINPIPPTLSLEHNATVFCAGIPTTFTLTETGSPSSLCSWTGPFGFYAAGGTVVATAPSTQGTYIYTVTVNLGADCSLCGDLTNTISITVLPNVPGGTLSVTASPTVCFNELTGHAAVTLHATGGGNAPGSYIWNPNPVSYYNTSHSITDVNLSSPGVYTYSVTIASASAGTCSGLGTTTFTVLPSPVFTVSPNPVKICIGETSATLTATGTPNTTYSWSPPAGLSSTTGSVVVASPNVYGTNVYNVTGSYATGCSTSKSVSVLVYPLPSFSINSANICPGATATINTISNNIDSYTVTSSTQTNTYVPPYYTNNITFTISPATTTVYTVTGSNTSAGCTATHTFEVIVKPIPTITAMATPTVICAGQASTLTASGASTYTWTNAGNSHQPSITVHPTVTSNYIVVGTGTNSCTNTTTVTVDVNPLPLPPIFSGALCQGQHDIIDITNTSSTYMYSWSGSGVSCISTATPTCSQVNINPATGTYSIITTNTLTGCTSNTTITTNPLPVITAPSATICSGSTASIHITSTATASVTHYTITTPAQTFTTTTGAITFTATPTVNTTYTVTGENASGCYSSNTFTITVKPLPTINVTYTPTLVCGAGHSETLTASGAGTASSYTWSQSGAHSATSVVSPPIGATTYTVSGAGLNGCVNTATITVDVYPLPPTPILSEHLCVGSSGTVAVTNTLSTSTTYTYSWVTPTGGTYSCVPTPTPACSQVDINNATGVYTVTVTDNHGCQNHTTFTPNPLPTVSITNTGIIPYCSASPHNIILTAHGATTYTWNTGSTATAITVQPLVTTTYTVTGTSAAGCGNEAIFTVSVTPSPTITITPSSYTVCEGSSATLTASGASTYTWTSIYSIIGNIHSMTIGTQPVGLGTFSYEVSGTQNGCTNSTQINLTSVPIPTITVSSLPTATICAGSTTTLTAHGASSYTWTPSTSLSTPTGSIVIADPTTTTIYTVTGGIGCTAKATETVTVKSAPTITVTNASICLGSTATLTASGATTYTWSANAGSVHTTSVIVSPTTTTDYTVTGTSGGCSSIKTATVTVTPTPTVTVNSATICAGSTTTLTAHGATTYSWTPPTGLSATTGSIVTANPTITQTYTITGTTGSCHGTSTATVIIAPNPTITVNTSTICAGSTTTLTAGGATTYTWSANAGGVHTGSVTVNPTITTDYTVTGTAAAGCSSTKITTVTVNPSPSVTVNSAKVCAGGTATLTANGATTYSWTPPTGLSATTGSTVTANLATTTSYTVTGTSSSGCSSSAVSVVTINPATNITVNSATICTGGTVILAATGATSYTWTPAIGLSSTTGSPVNASPSSTTVYTVNGATGSCISTPATSTVTVISTPTLTVNSETLCAGSSAILTAGGATNYIWSANAGSATTSTVSVSPTSTTIYTVTGSIGMCSSTVTSTVTITPAPSVTVNSTSICSGASATLTANGATTYTWTPPTGLNTTTGNIVIANPTITTTYTVTGTLSGCSASSSAISVVTVNPAPTLAITPSTNPVCLGTSATLTATGANTYTWVSSDSGVNGDQTSTVITSNLTGNTDYTVSGTSSDGCIGTSVITESITPGVVSITYSTTGNCSGTIAGSNTICAGEIVTLNANSSTANSYTWNPGSIVSPSITVSPTVTTTYTLNTSDGSGCAALNVFTLYVSPTCTTSGGSPLPNVGTASGTIYSLSNSFTITTGNSLTITTSTVYIAPTVSITIQTGASLTISNSYLTASTGSMWQGIVVLPGGAISVNNNTMIEDAVVGIDNGGSSTNIYSNQPPSIIQVNGAIFNCNYTAIREAYYKTSTSANYGTANFSVQNAVFTCRCGISQPQGTTPYLNTYTNVAGTANIMTPTINDFYSVANYPSSTLIAPYTGFPAYEGIHFENNYFGSNYSTNIYNINPPSAIQVPVIFDNLVYGINAINTTFSVTSSVFQNAQIEPATLMTSGGGGYGINSNHTLVDNLDGISVSKSQFIDLVRGINNIGYYDMEITNNTFFSTQVATPLNYTVTAPYTDGVIGDYGMYVSPFRFTAANLNNNTLANINNGIDFIITTNPGNGADGEYVGPVAINTNTLVNQFPTTNYTTAYIGNAIIADNAVTAPNAGGQVGNTGTEIQIQNNFINGAYRGILARNQQYQLVRTESNTVTIIPEPASNVTTTQYAIEHNRVLFGSASSPASMFPDIFNNIVTGFITSAYTSNYSNPSSFEPKKGIWCNLTANNYVTCNYVTNSGRGIEFSGYNDFTFWRLNQMNSCGEGFVLSNNSGTGIIQTQGGPNDGSDNTWSGFSLFNPETMADNSDASQSPLYINGAVTANVPINNNTENTGTAYTAYPNTVDLINSGNLSTSYNCSSNIAGRLANTHHNSSSTIYTPLSMMEKIAIDSLYYMSDSAQNSFINKDIVYRSIKQDTSLMTGSAILHNFYTASQTTCRQLFCLIEDSLYTGNYTYAGSLVSSFVPSCTIEQNYKRFYQIFINGMQNTATGADTADLETLASSCPLLNGSVVYQARSFHNSWYKGFKHYEDNCPASPTGAGYRKANATAISSISSNQNFSLNLYPNPSTGMIYVSGSDGSSHSYNAEVLDLGGKLLYKQNLSIENGLGKLKLNLDNGAYMLYLYSNDRIAPSIFKIMIAN